MITIGTVGTSNITQKFLSAAKESKRIYYGAAYSRNMENAKAFAQRFGADKYYDSLKEMAEDKTLDAVYIASPNFLHFEHTMLFLKAGKHVLCEKPLASNSWEATQMIEYAKEHNLVLLEAIRPIYDPGYGAIEANINKLGAIRHVRLSFGRYSSKYDDFLEGRSPNIFEPKCSAGALMDMGVYCVHPLIGLFGFPEKLQSACVKLSNGIDGNGLILGSYSDMIAELSYSKISDSQLHSEIQGELGTMMISEISSPEHIKIRYKNGKEEIVEVPVCENNMVYEAVAFADAIENGKDTARYHEISLLAMKLMDEVRKQQGILFPADMNIEN